ncbi:MAG: histidinol dehydrogenase [Nitrospirota bacterium]
MKIIDYKSPDFKKEIKRIRERGNVDLEEIEASVKKIISDVRKLGDKAVIEYTKKYDAISLAPSDMRVMEDDIKRAYSSAAKEDIDALQHSAERILAFHKRQKFESWTYEDGGIQLGQIVRPLAAVGMYVPGGKATYPSTVLMNAIPAKVAGVERLVMTVPAPRGEMNPNVLIAAAIAGVDEIYKIGGVQAIAALAFGTETIPKVDKIVGPGNIYVAVAKKLVFGYVDIDMIAGPSEILIVADETADPAFVAADMLSQAEHDERASAILVTPSKKIAEAVDKEISKQLPSLKRKEIVEKSINGYGIIIVVKDLMEAVRIANEIAPEHLELSVENPDELLGLIKNAGAIFLGHYTPEAVGDYVAGPSHTLPTGGTARFFSPLSVEDFLKRSSVISYPADELSRVAGYIERLAGMEGLEAHAKSVRIRVKKIRN